jgi:hypothetical protein
MKKTAHHNNNAAMLQNACDTETSVCYLRYYCWCKVQNIPELVRDYEEVSPMVLNGQHMSCGIFIKIYETHKKMTAKT